MSWSTNAILIKSDHSKDLPALLKKLGLKGAEAGEKVSFEDATSRSNDDVAVAVVDGWTALWGNLALFMVDEKAIGKITKKSDVFHMVLEGTSGTAGFSWWSDGKLVRDWLQQGDEIIPKPP